MRFESVDKNDTFFQNAFLHEYTKGDTLERFYTAKPTLENVKILIEHRSSFSMELRKVLHAQLIDQYAKSQIDLAANSIVKKNIDLILKKNTYTITTGQQIHLAIGPLYVMYKIWNTIALCQEAQAGYPESNFVPIFWMASEDHDLEEIQDIMIFGKKFRWETEQSGAVGRMRCTGIPELIEDMEASLNLDQDQKAFFEVCKEAYTLPTLADATRKIIHHYFGNHGVVVLDADDPKLKAYFKTVIEAELAGEHYAHLKKAGEDLKTLGFKPQIHIRDINLFLLGDGKRTRIGEGQGEVVSLSSVATPIDPYSISPNVALRPIYQECILPNLIYVGGPSETKYWAQLVDLFTYRKMVMPLVFVRSNVVITSLSQFQKTGLSTPGLLFRSEQDLLPLIEDGAEKEAELLNGPLRIVEGELSQYEAQFHDLIKGGSVKKKVDKIRGILRQLEKINSDSLVSLISQNTKLKAVKKLKKSDFSFTLPQERTEGCARYIALVSQFGVGGYSHFGFRNSHNVNVLLT